MTKNLKYYLKIVFVGVVILGLVASYVWSPTSYTPTAPAEPEQTQDFNGPLGLPEVTGPTSAPSVTGPTSQPPQ